METAKALFKAMSLEELINNYKSIVGFDWSIFKGNIEERYARVRGKYDQEFQKMLQTEYDGEIKESDIITYLDSLSLMKKLFELIYDLKGINVFMEYKIPYGQFKRIDYILAFKNTLVLLEFSLYDKILNTATYNNVYHKKLTQVMQYEKLLQNLISNQIKTVPYVVMYSPDFDENRNQISNSNELKIKNLSELIRLLYEKDTLASDEINKL